jgi:hypothetical protein
MIFHTHPCDVKWALRGAVHYLATLLASAERWVASLLMDAALARGPDRGSRAYLGVIPRRDWKEAYSRLDNWDRAGCSGHTQSIICAEFRTAVGMRMSHLPCAFHGTLKIAFSR